VIVEQIDERVRELAGHARIVVSGARPCRRVVVES
jgi:hypothetical protein